MNIRRAKMLAASAIDDVIAAAIADRDKEWHDALAEVDRPLLNINPVLPFAPETPEQVPELLRQLEARLTKKKG